MNYKIAKSMLILCIVYLVGFYILKFAFPELLIQTISSPTLIRLGEVLAKHTWFDHIVRTITTAIPIYLFACASAGRFKFTWYEFIYIIVGTIICRLCIIFFPSFYAHTSTAIMFLVAMLCKGKLIYSAITFAVHGYLSMFLTSIRGFETIILNINSVSGILISAEGYVWLILFAIIFNIKDNKNGRLSSPVCEQTHQQT